MIDGIPINFETMTPAGLYILLVLLLFFERVVPIGRVRDAQKAADILREANEKQAAVIATQAGTISTQGDVIKELTAVGETISKVMSELQRARDGSEA